VLTTRYELLCLAHNNFKSNFNSHLTKNNISRANNKLCTLSLKHKILFNCIVSTDEHVCEEQGFQNM
jgi:hypothetical protein